MTHQFSFLKVKVNALTAAMTLGVLFLLPSTSLGFGATIVEEVFGQLDLSILDEGQEEEGEERVQATSPSLTSTFLLRGIIATSLSAQGGDAPNENNSSSSYILAGRWRIFVDEGLVNRFIAEMNLATTNGTAFHNITIEDTAPHRFALMQSENGTLAATTTSTGSVPPVSADILTRISIDNNTPAIENVPATISIRGQVLTIEGIDIDETTIADTGQRDILSIIDGQTIFGVVPR